MALNVNNHLAMDAEIDFVAGRTFGAFSYPDATISAKGIVSVDPAGGLAVSSGALSLSAVGTPGTFTRVTVDAKGRVTAGDALSGSDVPAHMHAVSDVPGLMASPVFTGRSTFAAESEQYAVGANWSSVGGAVYFGARSNAGSPDAVISNAGGGTLMTLENGGNVGIGSAPFARFSVQGVDVTSQQIAFRSLDGNWAGRLGEIASAGSLGAILSRSAAWSATGGVFSAVKDYNGSYPGAALFIGAQFNSVSGANFRFLSKAAGAPWASPSKRLEQSNSSELSRMDWPPSSMRFRRFTR